MKGAPEISVVIPCYQEEENAAGIAAAVVAALEEARADFELIFIDNASTDRTVPIIRELCRRDSRIKLIVNSRNFGQMRSPTHGIYQAGGRAVIAMCADFQDPPALLGEFIRRWRNGAKVVLGVRQSERTGMVQRLIRNGGYRFLNRFGDYAVIPNATGFGLYDREVVDCLKGWNEPEPFFRGMLVESGYPIALIPFARPDRAAGKSNNDFMRLADFALSGLSASARKLIRLPFFLGLFMLGLSGICFTIALILLILDRAAAPFFWAAGIEIQFGLLFLMLGLIGDQVRLTGERTRAMPLAIEAERINFIRRDQ